MSKHVMLPVSCLKLCPFNPPTRTADSAVKTLEMSIQKHGVLSPLHVAKNCNGYFVADGNRRMTCAKRLGIKKVWCEVHNVAPSELPQFWAAINTPTRKISSYEWMVAYTSAHGNMKKTSIPQHTLASIKACQLLFGGLNLLIEKHVSPAIHNLVLRVHNLLSTPYLARTPSAKKIGMWMIKHKAQAVCQSLSRVDPPLRILRRLALRIEKNERFERTDLI